MHLALYRPGIPQNTGNIGRLCVGLRASLHVIGPCGFDFSDRALRRAALDYWPHLDFHLHPGEKEFLAWLDGRDPWLVTKHGELRVDRAPYEADAVLLLGNENTGLPDAWHARWPDRRVAIPILGPVRSFNQANAAAMVLAAALTRYGWAPAAPVTGGACGAGGRAGADRQVNQTGCRGVEDL